MEHQYKEIDGIQVAYLDEGEGYPVFFIPPWTSSHLAYEGITKHLKESPIRCIRVDLPGWGGNTRQTLKTKDFDSYVKFVSKFINSFGYKDYGVLGYSLGATFLLHAISDGLINPQKVVIVSSFHGKQLFTGKSSRLKRNLEIASVAIKLHVPSLVIKPIVGSFYLMELMMNDTYRKQARYFLRLINSSVASDRDSVVVPLITMPDMNDESLKSFSGNSMVIYNADEPWYFKESSEEIANMMHVSPTVVKGFSHRHFSFQPESSAQYIKEFILN